MRQFVVAVVGGLAVSAFRVEVLLAQTPKWPDSPGFERGPGFYMSWLKLIVCWLLFLIWVATADWINRDAQIHRFKDHRWNAIVFFPFVASFILLWTIPFFWVGFPLMLLAYGIPVGWYILYRNNIVPPHEQVMTGDHLRFVLFTRLNSLGFKLDAERKAGKDLGPPIELTGQGGADERENTAHLLLARQSEGFLPAREILAEALTRRCESLMLDYTAQAAAVRYEIDGVWHNGEARNREEADAALAVMKTIASLNAAERRARQQGTFGAKWANVKYTAHFLSQGTQTGERVLIRFDDGSQRIKKLSDTGMRDKLQEQVGELLKAQQGFVIFSAPPRGGLTALMNAALNSSDRFTRGWVAVEEVTQPERTIENVAVTTYNAAEGETPDTVLPRLVRQYPDVIIVRDLVNPETINLLVEQLESNRLIITGVKAKDSAEALLRILAMKPNAAKFIGAVSGVVNGRLIRKLCDTCKEAYAPPPQVLQQLRLPVGKIEAFYRPPQTPEEVCPDCGGIGYYGRTAIFEVLNVDDGVRQTLATTPRLDALRVAARKAGMRTLQEDGILLVVKGVTSLQELMRALKE
ncbi:MAG: Flp pilus assembly complex ATPase component TadA [Pirellulales bacterium]|nr:Flp pilus assembly complex ATPase component TadA [Pirellulales bacterium]